MSAAGGRDLTAAESRELRQEVGRWLTEGPRCSCGHNWLEHHGVDPDDGCMGIPLWRCPCRLVAEQVVGGVEDVA